MKYNCLKKTESAAVSSALMISGIIEGECVQMLIDTVSAVTILREDVWRRSHESCQLSLLSQIIAAN